jgi:hypothetical protein
MMKNQNILNESRLRKIIAESVRKSINEVKEIDQFRHEFRDWLNNDARAGKLAIAYINRNRNEQYLWKIIKAYQQYLSANGEQNDILASYQINNVIHVIDAEINRFERIDCGDRYYQ